MISSRLAGERYQIDKDIYFNDTSYMRLTKQRNQKRHTCARLTTAVFVIAGSMGWSILHAQEAMKYRISWPENPPVEDIGWYILESYDRKSNSWKLIIQTTGTEMDGMLTYENKLYTLGAFDRADVACIRITAAKGTQRSTPSAPTCFAVPAIAS